MSKFDFKRKSFGASKGLATRDDLNSLNGAGQRLTDLPKPWFCGHRGGRLLGPEHSMELYRRCVDGGFAVEAGDMRALVDGTLVPIHDSTVDRTMTITGNVSDTSFGAWVGAKIKASAIPGGPGMWSDVAAPTMAQVVAEFGNSAVLVPNPTSVVGTNALIDMYIRNGVHKDSVIIAAGGSQTVADAAVARGWHTSMDTDPANAVAKGIEWITGDVATFTQAQVDAAKAAGRKVMLYTVIRRHEVAALTGVDAWYSDDPWYVSGDTRFERKTDPFAAQSWVPGMPPPGVATTERGKFYTGGWWGFDLNAATTTNVGHYYLAPTNPSSYTLDLTLQIDAVNAGDMTRGAMVYLGQTDKYWNDQSPTTSDGPDGYGILLKADGNAAIYRKDYTTGDISTNLGTSVIGSALTLGTPVTYRITVSAGSISVARTDAGATTANVKNDTTYRGLRYITLGRYGAGVRFKSIAVS